MLPPIQDLLESLARGGVVHAPRHQRQLRRVAAAGLAQRVVELAGGDDGLLEARPERLGVAALAQPERQLAEEDYQPQTVVAVHQHEVAVADGGEEIDRFDARLAQPTGWTSRGAAGVAA